MMIFTVKAACGRRRVDFFENWRRPMLGPRRIIRGKLPTLLIHQIWSPIR